MNVAILRLPKLMAERRSSALLGLALIAMLWAGIFTKFWDNAQTDQRNAERDNQNYAMVFEENVLRSIGEIDKALLYLRRTIEARKGAADFHTIVNTTDLLSEIIVQVAIIDANGVLRASNAGPQPAPALDLSDREHYRAHLNSPEDRLFISKPLVGRASGRWSVQFTRRFVEGDGRFGGVVVASLDPEHLTKFYDKIDLGPSASIALVGGDGVVRSSGGRNGLPLGTSLGGTGFFDQITTADQPFEAVAPPGGTMQLVTVRKVRDYPLWVVVSIDRIDIFESSLSTFKLHAGVGVLLTLMILFAVDRILQTEDRAAQKARQLELTLEHMSQGIMLVTSDLHVPVINGRCGELLDLPPKFIKDPPRFDQLLDRTILTGRSRHGAGGAPALSPPAAGEASVGEYLTPNGIVVECRRRGLPDGSFVQTFTDVTERSNGEAYVARLASEDPLTGLLNRRVFRSALDKISQQGADDRQSGGEFALLMLDVDRFKVINDTLGHRVGDLLLQEVGRRLQHTVRPADLLARLSGDEFAVIASLAQSREAVAGFAEKILKAVAEPYAIDGHRIRASVSIGIAVAPQDGQNADDLLMASDLALYAVKAEKRGAYKFYNSAMTTELNDRRQIEMDLREAIERRELELHYQPVVDLRRNAITGFEALARWRHPVRGMVPPAQFIPVAEDSGLILPLGEWSLTEACRQATHWPDTVRVAVNLSPVQFAAPNLVQVVERILADTGLRANRLELEITENVFLEDSESTLQTLRSLKQLGIRIAMDDFGTGYSSLSYLRSFPFDRIKVDRSFLKDFDQRGELMAIVQAVLAMARALGMTTTAEGVEKSYQQEFLSALGCEEAQGYLFGAPGPCESAAALLAAQRPTHIWAA